MTIRTLPRTVALGALSLAAVGVLAGCTAADPEAGSHEGMPGMSEAPTTASPGASGTEANDADAMFAGMMIGHHEQAIEMSDLVLGKDGVDPRVVDLATRIKAAQAPEIEQLRGWLADWGAAEPSGPMDHGDGMMSEDDLAALEAAAGSEANRLFLEQMIVHHEGAVAMAEDQLAKGESPEALALAQAIVDAQTAEIQEMRDLLTAL